MSEPLRVITPVDPWEGYQLKTILTEPCRHELSTPEGKTIPLDTGDFLHVTKFTTKFLDVTGKLPPFPEKMAGRELRRLVDLWFATRTTVVPDMEASDSGLLRSDIQSCLRAAPETDQGSDLERGAILLRQDMSAVFVARLLLDRVRRVCPVKFTPYEFYEALIAIGCTSIGPQRIGHWRGRVWAAPESVFGDPIGSDESGEILVTPVTKLLP